MDVKTPTDRARNPRDFAELDRFQARDDEPIIDPELPIIDAHHHLWDRSIGRYMFDELMRDINGGHNVRNTVYVECDEMLRAGGPEEFRVVGETEFAAGVAAQSESGRYGPQRVCSAIVGAANLSLGTRAEAILQAHIEAGGGRFRGIRDRAAVEPSLDWRPQTVRPGLLRDANFRDGFARLEPLGLSFEAWLFHTQIDDLIDLADAFPHTTIVLNHVGGVLGIGAYEGRRAEVFSVWRDRISNLAERPNVVCKIGGLGMVSNGFDFSLRAEQPSSQELAEAWKPYILHCLEEFGADRCMAESNFPPDRQTCSYRTMWNAYKAALKDCSTHEKSAIFHGTASRVYRIELS